MAESRKNADRTLSDKTRGDASPLPGQDERTLSRQSLAALCSSAPTPNLLAWSRTEATARRPLITLGWGLTEGPVGPLLLAWVDERLCWLGLAGTPGRAEAMFHRDWPEARHLRDDREATLRAPAALGPQGHTIPLLMTGTEFQLQVWRTLLAIPWGHVTSYAAVAAAVGRPRGTQAVGAAVGANPVAIAVPCHRVVGRDGRLHGYAWGLDIKRTLLDRERLTPPAA